MAQSGFTPIQLYFSTTAAATPSAGNLANGELALNITDGRLFYKDNGGVVRVLAGTGGTGVVAGSNTQVQFNNNGVFGASANMVFNGTRLTVADLADSGLTSGRVTYASSGGALVDSANLTFDGTNLTLGGGTANGVTYLNGSKVLTSGSALTFDGTNLGVGGAPNTYSGYTAMTLNNAVNGPILDLNYAGTRQGTFLALTNELRIGSIANIPFTFYQNGSEQMRLNNTGLGIGTSSPGTKLDVVGQVRSQGSIAAFVVEPRDGSGAAWSIYNPTGDDIRIFGNSADRLILDNSGNLGLGVTPSASNACTNIELPFGATLSARSNTAAPQFAMMSNAVGNWFAPTYKINGFATQYTQQGFDGTHKWYTAPSGTAGNAISFTQAMTLDAAGDLGVGTTNPDRRLAVASDGTNWISGAFAGNGGTARVVMGNLTDSPTIGGHSAALDAWAPISISGTEVLLKIQNTERARINSSGNLLVGTTAAYGSRLDVAASLEVASFQNTSGTGNVRFINSAASTLGYIQWSGSTTSYVTSSDYRLKEDIQPMTSALARIAALKPVTYKWKVDGSDGEGFIAHELAEVVPQCVTGEKDAVDAEGKPQYQGIDTSFLVATLTAAIQEQQAIITALTARVAALESN